jgi:copper oxidase (laccase) domain-containing protein
MDRIINQIEDKETNQVDVKELILILFGPCMKDECYEKMIEYIHATQ